MNFIDQKYRIQNQKLETRFEISLRQESSFNLLIVIRKLIPVLKLISRKKGTWGILANCVSRDGANYIQVQITAGIRPCNTFKYVEDKLKVLGYRKIEMGEKW